MRRAVHGQANPTTDMLRGMPSSQTPSASPADIQSLPAVQENVWPSFSSESKAMLCRLPSCLAVWSEGDPKDHSASEERATHPEVSHRQRQYSAPVYLRAMRDGRAHRRSASQLPRAASSTMALSFLPYSMGQAGTERRDLSRPPLILQRWADYTGQDPVREDGVKWSSLGQKKSPASEKKAGPKGAGR